MSFAGGARSGGRLDVHQPPPGPTARPADREAGPAHPRGAGAGYYRRGGHHHQHCGGGARVRYALISNLHANLPATLAVHADIARRGLGAVYHLGDLVGYAPWPNEVVGFIAEADGFAALAVGPDCRLLRAHGWTAHGSEYEPGSIPRPGPGGWHLARSLDLLARPRDRDGRSRASGRGRPSSA